MAVGLSYVPPVGYGAVPGGYMQPQFPGPPPGTTAMVVGPDLNRNGIPDILEGGPWAVTPVAMSMPAPQPVGMVAVGSYVAQPVEPKLPKRIRGERPTSREELISTGNLLEAPPELLRPPPPPPRMPVVVAPPVMMAPPVWPVPMAPPPPMTIVTGVDMNRNGIPDWLEGQMAQAGQMGMPPNTGPMGQQMGPMGMPPTGPMGPPMTGPMGPPMTGPMGPPMTGPMGPPMTGPMGAPMTGPMGPPYGPVTMTVTGPDMNRNGIPDILEGPMRPPGPGGPQQPQTNVSGQGLRPPSTAMGPAPMTNMGFTPMTTAMGPVPMTTNMGGPGAMTTAMGPAPMTTMGGMPMTTMGPAPTNMGSMPMTAMGPVPMTTNMGAPPMTTAMGPAAMGSIPMTTAMGPGGPAVTTPNMMMPGTMGMGMPGTTPNMWGAPPNTAGPGMLPSTNSSPPLTHSSSRKPKTH